MSTYETVIGLEVHVQIGTKTKLFCSCSTAVFGLSPNTSVCPICMGFPGMLPVLNKVAVEKGIQAALALNCSIPSFSKFDRKNYFYPDLPKGFQISQYDQPVAVNGWLTLNVNGKERKITIHRLHLEDDAGKLSHAPHGTWCDYNRSGVPLMEIVSAPDLRSAEEASLYAKEIQKIVRAVGASEADMEKGMMRFDINVSLRKKGAKELGTKVEIKNVNSFRALERGIAYEIERQSALLDKGEPIAQETRGWDDDKGISESQRSKEAAHDYRYFPEPDLPPLELEEKFVEELRASLPELPNVMRARFLNEYGLAEADAQQLSDDTNLGRYFETASTISTDPKRTAAFILTIVVQYLNEKQIGIAEFSVSAENLGTLLLRVKQGTVSFNQAKAELFNAMLETGKDPDTLIKKLGITQVTDIGAIEALCAAAIAANPQVVADYKAGKGRAMGFLIGQIMKESKGKANPAVVTPILEKLLRS